jgi:hypothetical protein
MCQYISFQGPPKFKIETNLDLDECQWFLTIDNTAVTNFGLNLTESRTARYCVFEKYKQGPMLWFEKYFRQKMELMTQNKAKSCKILIITLVSEKNTNFFTENCRKSRKINIITSTPGPNPTTSIYNATGSLARFESYFEKRSSLLQSWRCSCKLKIRRIGPR